MNDGVGLQFDDLSVAYGHHLALRDVSAHIPPGTVTGLIGPNGAGKSTLINAVAGTVPPHSGSITFNGRPLDRKTTPIAFVPQGREVNWDFPLSALDLVMMGRYRRIGWLRRAGPGDRDAAMHALDELGLAEYAGRHISQFSGGQQQRLFLARARVMNPEIVLFDEPMTGVDVTTRTIINEMVRDFARRGATVLLATHDLEEVQEICDAILALNCRMVAFGPTDRVFTPTTLRATFGGQVVIFG